MNKFTQSQIDLLKQGNLDFFTEEHRYHQDDQGNGILHYLIMHHHEIGKIKDAVIRLHANPHICNKGWKNPILLAIEKNLITVASFLLEQPIQADKDYFIHILGAARKHYYEYNLSSFENRKITTGFYASVLCGEDIHNLLRKETNESNSFSSSSLTISTRTNVRKKYRAHLDWLSGYLYQLNQSTGIVENVEHLEGFFPHDFLPIRIRNTLEILLRVHGSSISDDNLRNISPEIQSGSTTALWRRRCQLSNELKNELQRELQTFLIIKYAKAIKNILNEGFRMELEKSLVQGVISSICSLEPNASIVIETGSSDHCVYMQIKRINADEYDCYIHNLGLGLNWHVHTNDVSKYFLAKLKRNAWNNQAEGFLYLSNIFNYLLKQAPVLWSSMQPELYDKQGPFSTRKIFKEKTGNVISVHDFRDTSFLERQKVANCVVVNHDASRHFTMNPCFADWIEKEERSLDAEIRADRFFPALDMQLWENDLIAFPDNPKLEKSVYIHKLIDITNRKLESINTTIGGDYTIPRNMELNNLKDFIDTSLSRCLFLGGAAGIGKSVLTKIFFEKHQSLREGLLFLDIYDLYEQAKSGSALRQITTMTGVIFVDNVELILEHKTISEIIIFIEEIS